MQPSELQLVMSVLMFLGSGFGAYGGVKIGIAEVKKDISYLLKEITELKLRVRELENELYRRTK